MNQKEAAEEKLAKKKERLQLYLEREKTMLSPAGVKAYGIGSRNLERYDTALADVQKMIARLQKEIEELEARQDGRKPRKAVGAVIRDW